MSSEHYCMADHGSWRAANLRDDLPGDGAEYVNQEPDGFDCYCGEWYDFDDARWIIYWGTFGNYNSPGASHYTYAEIYDTAEEYKEAVAAWEAKEEYNDTGEDEPSEDTMPECPECGKEAERLGSDFVCGDCGMRMNADDSTAEWYREE